MQQREQQRRAPERAPRELSEQVGELTELDEHVAVAVAGREKVRVELETEERLGQLAQVELHQPSRRVPAARERRKVELASARVRCLDPSAQLRELAGLAVGAKDARRCQRGPALGGASRGGVRQGKVRR